MESQSPIHKLKITSPGFAPQLEKVVDQIAGREVFDFGTPETEHRKFESKKPEIGIKLKLTKPVPEAAEHKKKKNKRRKDRTRGSNRFDEDDSSSDDDDDSGDVGG